MQDSAENYATSVFIHGKEYAVAPALNYEEDTWVPDGSGLSWKTQQLEVKIWSTIFVCFLMVIVIL